MINTLVIGYGSIGARHARILTELGCSTAILSRRSIEMPLVFSDIATALAVHTPEYIVIANETPLHYAMFTKLAELGFQGTLLIEKPLFDQCRTLPKSAFKNAYVAYNLRYHPIITRLKAILSSEKLLSVQVYVGQYLPDWRPDTDYRLSYSADAQGGGVLRDLSHELDYLNWMLGGWNSVAALGGHVSSLEIGSADVFSLLMTTPKCPIVSVQMNYLDRRARRSIIINTDSHTIEADLVGGSITIDSAVEFVTVERDVTYRGMHQAVLAGKNDVACSLEEGMATLSLIDAAIQSAENQEWIKK